MASNGSPTRPDHSQALLILTQELKLAKDQIPSLEDRVRILENELQMERSARETAEERAQKLETSSITDSMEPAGSDPIPIPGRAGVELTTEPDLQGQLERLRATMDDMKQHMESYRRRAEKAESERDEARQTLAEMVLQKRAENAKAQRRQSGSSSPDGTTADDHLSSLGSNGHVESTRNEISITTLLEKAGLKGHEALTNEHATSLRQLLTEHAPLAFSDGGANLDDSVALNATPQLDDRQTAAMKTYASYWGPTIAVLFVGALAMAVLDKMEAVHR